jgi:hypothetical protein
MKKQIFWIKFCALLLVIMLMVHSLEVAYDILYHIGNGSFFNTAEIHHHPHDLPQH